MKRRSKLVLGLLAGCALAGPGLGWIAWKPASPNAGLFDTDSLIVRELAWSLKQGRCVVRGTLENHSDREALSVVVVLEMRDPDGEVVATNPMVEVLRVPGNASTPFEGALSVRGVVEPFEVTATVAAARWD
ncbi:MAG: hypothetical protein JXB13_07105 [Phycisphaerae bacterium]|nr:hypothetical protein [Phycisphaerae bacterium]